MLQRIKALFIHKILLVVANSAKAKRNIKILKKYSDFNYFLTIYQL